MLELPQSLREHFAHLQVAVYGSGGSPSHHLALLASWELYPHVVSAEHIRAGEIAHFDAVIFPGGGLAAMAGQLKPLGEEGMRALRDWVGAGGTYLGSCAGSCHPLRMREPYRQSNPEAEPFQICDVTPLNAAEGSWGLDSPGTGRLRVAPEIHPLFEGLREPFEIVHYNGPLFPAKGGAVGQVLEPTRAFTPFETSQSEQREKTTLSHAIASNARIAYSQRFGAGQVILFGSHPEFGSSPLQLGFLPAARLLANALGLSKPRISKVNDHAVAEKLLLTEDLLGALTYEVERLVRLLTEATSLSTYLPAEAPAFLGLSGPSLWNAALTEAQGLLSELKAWLMHCPSECSVYGLHLLDTTPSPSQDVGFMGVCQGLGYARGLTQQALVVSVPWPAFTGAYNELATHPYHLLVSSYLSACGLVAAMALQVNAFAALNALPPISLTSKEALHAAQTL